MKSLNLTSAPWACAALATFLIYTACAPRAQASLIITGVMEPTTSVEPRVVELYALANVNLGVFTMERYNDASTTVTTSLTLSGTLSAGNFFYVVDNATSQAELDTWFGVGVITLGTNAIGGSFPISGDDPLRLRQSSTTRDLFGVIGTDGSGQPWEYTDGWAYRKSGTFGDTSSFTLANWTFSGANALDPASTGNGGSGVNGGNGTPAFPIGSYSEDAPAAVPEPGSLLLIAVAGLLLLAYHRFRSSSLAAIRVARPCQRELVHRPPTTPSSL